MVTMWPEKLDKRWRVFLHKASPQHGDLTLLGPPSGRGADGGARTRETEGSLQISGRTHKPLCQERWRTVERTTASKADRRDQRPLFRVHHASL
ncbi:hypothetical protein PoB_005312200 [Plakobranchus ocellatus]|uniref:Uncharacterized protein n=1 Tax=Plakobranchus ocellatus TaxID=259542 RepID=A0AAV4C5H2_9GAST|nr:hypothetical protein PoB_005312200 [Plakobranchus ocellatus]